MSPGTPVPNGDRVACFGYGDGEVVAHVDAAVGEQLDHVRVQLVLDLVDVGLEGIDVPALLHRQRTLGDDGAGVVGRVGEVDGHACDLDAALIRVVDGMCTRKARQQRRMQVDDAVGERCQQRVADHAHVAGHDDVLDAVRHELVRDDLVGRDGVGVDLFGKREGLDTRALGALQALRGRAARHDELDRGVERAVGDAVDERLQVGAGAGDEHADLQRLELLACRTRSGARGLDVVAGGDVELLRGSSAISCLSRRAGKLAVDVRGEKRVARQRLGRQPRLLDQTTVLVATAHRSTPPCQSRRRRCPRGTASRRARRASA